MARGQGRRLPASIHGLCVLGRVYLVIPEIRRTLPHVARLGMTPIQVHNEMQVSIFTSEETRNCEDVPILALSHCGRPHILVMVKSFPRTTFDFHSWNSDGVVNSCRLYESLIWPCGHIVSVQVVYRS